MDPSDPLALQPNRPEAAQPRLGAEPPRSIGSLGSRLFARRRDRQRYGQELEGVLAQRQQLRALDEAALTLRMAQVAEHLRRAMARGAGMQDATHRSLALALAALAAERVLAQTASDAQIVAALAICDSRVVQLPAGQGKTLAVALAAVLSGWATRCCHVVCATEPLALRDAIAMRPLYQRCGLVNSVVTSITPQEHFEHCYKADVLYGAARRFMADTYRDLRLFGGIDSDLRRRLLNAADPPRARRPMTRGLVTAIVDDIDRVLIDEATSPLVISEPSSNPLLLEAAAAARGLVDGIEAGSDYRLTPEGVIEFTDEGLERLDQLQEHLPPLWRVPRRRDDLMKQAILARDVLRQGHHYAVDGGRVAFHEERVAEAVREKTQLFGLTQAIEAREGLPLTHPPKTVERVSFQGFFRRYAHLGGIASALSGVGAELRSSYGLTPFNALEAVTGGSAPLPAAATTRAYVAGQEERLELIGQTVDAWLVRGCAIVIGARRPDEMTELVALLRKRGVTAVTLDPDADAERQVTREEFMAAAGRPGSVVVIPEGALTGDQLPLDSRTTAEGGLRLLLAQPLDLARTEAAFFSLAARQGGAAERLCILSFDDRLLAQYLRSLAGLLRRFCAEGARRRMALDAATWLARLFAVSAARAQRRQLLLREASLRNQLSFAGGGRYSSRTAQDAVPSLHSEPAKG